MRGAPLVSIQILSYNHAEGLTRAIDSILRQKTSFDYEIVVHDDASSDESQALLVRYSEENPGLFKLILRKENVYGRYGFGPIHKSLYEMCSGKYLALLECDDEWADDNKLQMQVDMLEYHPEASLCVGGYIEEYGNTRRIVYGRNGKLLTSESDGGAYYTFTRREWSRRWLTKTLTAVIRRDALARLIEESPKYLLLRDIHLFYYLLQEGYGIYLTRALGIYHICKDGMFGAKSRQEQRRQHKLCYRELWENLHHPILLRLWLEKCLSLVFHKPFDGQLTIPG